MLVLILPVLFQLIRTSSRLSVGRDLAGQGGTPTAVDSYGYRKDEYSVFGGNQED